MTNWQAEPIIALRSWKIIHNNILTSTFLAIRWPKKVPFRATCSPEWGCQLRFQTTTPIPPVPHFLGTCGIYAVKVRFIGTCPIEKDRENRATHAKAIPAFFYWDGSYLCHHEHMTIGLVALWGRIVTGDHGVYRAEYAYPLALFMNPQSDNGTIQKTAAEYHTSYLRCPDNLDDLHSAIESARRSLSPSVQGGPL